MSIFKLPPIPKDTQKLLSKSLKKHTDDIASKTNILHIEIGMALEEYNLKYKTSITMDQLQNQANVVEAFLRSRTRPQVVHLGVEIIYMTTDAKGVAIIPTKEYFPEAQADQFTAVLVPKTVTGDVVSVNILMHHLYHADGILVEVENSGARGTIRNDRLVICDKFNECAGCNLQMISYDDQLNFKQKTIQKAYSMFYPELYDEMSKSDVGYVTPSPMEYAYRTKLTPHFKIHKKTGDITIGFNNVHPTKDLVNVENCSIATKTVNQELPQLTKAKREQLVNNPPKKNEGTLLLRESIRIDFKTGEYEMVCLTDPKKVVTEKVEDFVFQFPANEFFQNNNTILPMVLDFIRFHLEDVEFKHIIDTYCGSGFFGISLSKSVPEDGKVFGIELAKASIMYATHNAKINGLKVPEQVHFIEGDANEIFANKAFKKAQITGDDSIVIMDPSRKGSDENFLNQVIQFKPKVLVYVSCDVFTQARDLGYFMRAQGLHKQYRIKAITGFDFFPQTKHVESVAILERI